MENENLNTKQAAMFLCISLSKLFKMCHKKEIPYSKVGRINVFRLEDLQAYLNANRVLTQDELKVQAEKFIKNRKKTNNHLIKGVLHEH